MPDVVGLGLDRPRESNREEGTSNLKEGGGCARERARERARVDSAQSESESESESEREKVQSRGTIGPLTLL